MRTLEEWKSNDGYSRDFDNMDAVMEVLLPEDVHTVKDGVPMQLNIQTQAIMDMNIKTLNIKEVTNPSCFEAGSIPTIGGLYSEAIFGTTQIEKQRKWGYVELNTTVIHPYIYTVLCKLQANIDQVCCGKGSWKIDNNNQLVKVSEGDPDYNPANTGMNWFISNYDKIKFKRNKSRERDERIDLLNTFAPGEIFIHTWMIMPVFYRSVEFNDGPPRKPDITKLYETLLRYSISLKRVSGFEFMSNAAKYNIQTTLVAIHKLFQEMIQKSKGFFHRYVLGKSPDYGARSVISCAVLDQYDKPEDCPIDMTNTGVPLAQVCGMVFPFIQRWVYNYLENLFRSNPMVYTNKDTPENTKDLIQIAPDAMDDYSPQSIQTRIDGWLNTYENRFAPVMVKCADGKRRPIRFTGRPYSSDPDNAAAATISKRYLTWTDVLYMAAVDSVENKVVWITRYPITQIQNTVPTHVHVMSTIKTIPVLIGGKIYPYYPIIDPKLPKNIIERSFNDTVNMTNLLLEGMGGDYDGDTVSMRVPYLEESNEESTEIMRSLKQYLNAQGAMIRNTSNESHFMLYNMTRSDPSAPRVDDITKGKILAMDYKEIGIKRLTKLFGTSYNRKTKKFIEPEYNLCAKVHLKAGEFTNTEDVDTTLGRLVFNKIIIAPYISKIVPGGYLNDEMTSKKTKKFFELVGRAAMYNKISTDDLWPFLKAFEFYTTKGVTIFAPSYSSELLIPKKEFLKEKEKFFKDNPNPTIDDIVNMQSDLVSKATKTLEKDPSYPLFASDARGSVADNYKTMDILIGPVQNPTTGEWNRIESSYIEGIKKNEISVAGNALINAQYPKSCGTAESGYITKQFNAVFQAVTVDEDGTDCGTKSYIMVKITENNWKLYEFQNVYDGDKLVVLDETTYKKFLGKFVKMRSPMCCTNTTICSVCAGRRPYIMQVRNIGLQFSDLSNQLLNAGMKKFHTAKVELDEIDPEELLN